LPSAPIVGVFTAFLKHVLAGGEFEPRTLGAMTVRSLVWIAIAFAAGRAFNRAPSGAPPAA
jgi:hypothetical protein